MNPAVPRIAITTGEPAGIGPDLVLEIARQPWPAEIVAFGDPKLLANRARLLGHPVELREYQPAPPVASRAGTLTVAPVGLATPSTPGHLDPRNAAYVLEMLKRATAGCRLREFAAMVTAPVHKGVINEAGIRFTGHTEYLAELTAAPRPVMLLVADTLRVALVTTHLPLREVPGAIRRDLIEDTAIALEAGLRRRFGIPRPRILVLGLNPHAGESGHLGREEIDEIAPAIEALAGRGLRVTGPVPADTAFVDRHLAGADAVLAMYHDQGLPVLKHRGFGRAVNVTLGLPIIRTSVDHGTALDLAGTGQADAGSLRSALELAIEIAGRPS